MGQRGNGAAPPTGIDRRPGQPSVNAVTSVSSVRLTARRLCRISAEMSVTAFATAPNTCRPPLAVSTFPTRTSRCRSPSSRLRMNVESTLTVIAAAAAVVGWSAVAVPSCSPIRSVWWRNVSGLLPASMGNRCCRTSAATRRSSGRKGEPAVGPARVRSASRWPTNARFSAIADYAQKPAKPHRHFAEQRRDAVPPPILQVASSAAGPATRPQLPMAVDLPGNHRSLNARQKLLRFGQRQTQVRDIAK